ncbi:putative O-methyltransferase YrrM [Azospirillum sp. OGB3]|uniref:class I SAM-dependent methyltransferase n=1 Tax=Azospirillum sp. OGB3 TaxID=2587012 RepID=UPI00160681EA|nr:class I SAM-dependent methyltransferase [Azospirillum sp. OGB3]MBB3267910.1 putative O-methyltransferase YrrM [Azospirillum sp. OGB3]
MRISNFVGNEFFFPDNLSPHKNVDFRHGMLMTIVSRVLEQKDHIRILEIGSWCGVSSLIFAEAIQKFSKGEVPNPDSFLLCVDPWTPYLDNADLAHQEHYRLMEQAAASDAVYETFRHNTALGARLTGVRIDHVRGDSRSVLPYLRNEYFDIVYIDGSHYYEAVKSDIEHAMRLVESGGFICGDDLEGQLHDVDEEQCVANRNSDFIRDVRTGGQYHPGVTLAVGRAFGNVSNYGGFWVARKGADGYEKVAVDALRCFAPLFLSPEEGKAFQEKMNGITPTSDVPPLLNPEFIEELGTYNIIRYRQQFYCIPHHAGPFSTAPDWLETLNGWGVIRSTLEEARAECRFLTERRAEREARRRTV